MTDHIDARTLRELAQSIRQPCDCALKTSRYESATAPIAPAYFPYNRCDVYACAKFQGAVLAYTEFGGYYVDKRARRVDPACVMEAPLAP